MKRPLIILTGPTAVGKTATVYPAGESGGGRNHIRRFHAGIPGNGYRIRQNPAGKKWHGVPHYLVDVLEPEEEFNVVKFQRLARQAAEEIYSRNKIPIVVGGTVFYIQALLYDIDFTENDGDISLRQELEKTAEEKGPEYLHQLLQEVDPQAARDLHPNNIKRVIRALEFYRQTGQRIFGT